MQFSWWPVGQDSCLALLMGLVWSAAAAAAAAAAADIVALSLPKYHLHSYNKKRNSTTYLRVPPRSGRGSILSTSITSAPG